MTVDLVLVNARIRWGGAWTDAGLAVEEGRIERIAREPSLPAASARIDLQGHLLIPGAIDTHTHFTYGRPDRTDIGTGSRAAASGGVTMFVEQAASTPEHCPPSLTPEAFHAKVELGRRSCVVDFGVHAGATPGNWQHFPELATLGAAGAKAYMSWRPVGDFDLCDDAALFRAAEAARPLGLPVEVHAENLALVEEATRRLKEAGRTTPDVYTDSRPTITELDAVSRVGQIALATGAPMHVVHLSSGYTAAVVRRAREAGADLTVETCPQYLFFDTRAYETFGPYAKCNPPLRSADEVAAMWRALQDGTVDFLASDHAAPSREKAPGAADIFAIPPGMPGCETMLPVMLSETIRGRLTWDRLLEILVEAPARRYGYYPRKGAILPRSDADLVEVDPKAETVVRNERLHHHSEFTLFEGRELRGVPVRTFARGEVVAEGVFPGDVVGKAGRGEFVPARHRAA